MMIKCCIGVAVLEDAETTRNDVSKRETSRIVSAPLVVKDIMVTQSV